MSIPVLTFLNNEGSSGKTPLAYHLAWMFAELGRRVLALDLDPRAGLTSALLEEEQLEALWARHDVPNTIYRCVRPGAEETGTPTPVATAISARLHLLAGDVKLARFEEVLSREWTDSLGDSPQCSLRGLTSLWQAGQMAAREVQADLIVTDLGPNLGAINRSALLGTDFTVLALGADLISLHELKNTGPALRHWRSEWAGRLGRADAAFEGPNGAMHPLGYVIQQPGMDLGRPVQARNRWVNQVPAAYREGVLQQDGSAVSPAADPNCLATIKHFRALGFMAQEARAPIFALRPADGATGSHALAVREAYLDFQALARKILAGMERRETASSPRG